MFVTTTLKSPESAIVQTLARGQLLTLEFHDEVRGTVVAMTEDGRIAGSVASGSHAQMVECMRRGFKFVAIVVAVIGGACEVEVRPRAE